MKTGCGPDGPGGSRVGEVSQSAAHLAPGTPRHKGWLPSGMSFLSAPFANLCRRADALLTGKVTMVVDQAGLAHVAVPLTLEGEQLGSLIAGQVFSRYPEPLPLQRVAREMGISGQRLWKQAVEQVPVSSATLRLYGDLLMSFGQAFLGQRYAAILHRRLDQNSRRYRLFFDGVRDHALLTLDRAGRISSWNSGAERLFGYRENEIVGENVACLIVSENASQEVEQRLSDADRLGSVEYEGWRARKDGTQLLAAGVVAAIGTGADREYGVLIRDVTQQRRSEDELRQAQKMEGLGVLAGGIAHDFNNLLTGILLSLSVVKTALLPADPAYPVLEIAERSSLRAAELVAQFLAYAGKGKFVTARFELSSLISEILPLITSGMPKNVEIKLSLASGMSWIDGDASQIRQVVMNLIINGAEAIGPEGGIVEVSTGVSDSGADVFMEVKDSGSGMDDQTKSRIFDPFFTTKFAGRGLGLAAVSGIVRSHKGKMDVASVPGRGTTFTVSFPAVADGVLEPAAVSPLIVGHPTGTILVVDDESAVRELTGVILERVRVFGSRRADGREAVEMFREHAADIAAVVLDLTMPGMSSHETYCLIRGIQPGVPIIASSGYGETSAREKLGGDAITGFLQKPYSATKLLKSIQEAVEYRSQP